MQHSKQTVQREALVGHPAAWDEQDLRRNWLEELKTLVEKAETTFPLKRVRFQVEQSATYRDIMRRWPGMNEPERISAWRSLLEASEQTLQELLPTCVRCGECCRKSSPTLQLADLELLREGKIPWHALVTLRRGEPVRSPLEEKVFFLIDERIKIREKAGTQECIFFDAEKEECTIYTGRPEQCRAQACWDSTMSKHVADQPYLTRRDIFKEVELLPELIAEHDRRCAFDKLENAFKKLEETKGESIDEVLELLAYEDHFRHFLGEKLLIPEENLELVFGRSFADLVGLFGFRVESDPEGAHRLVLDPSQD